jgi:DNA-binding NtrC family response regulator
MLGRESPETRVIVMTAHGSPEMRKCALAAGASSYWDKPIDIESLLEEIQRWEPTGRVLDP